MRKTRSARAIFGAALLAAAVAAGCGGSAGAPSRKQDGGGYPGDTGGSSATGGSGGGFGTGGRSGTGGFSGGSGGSSSTGGAPAGGAGGSSNVPDAGSPSADASPAPADAGGDAPTGPLPPPPSTCGVSIVPVMPLSLDGLPVGSRLRVEATATGMTAPKMPAWEWTVQHLSSGLKIPTTAVNLNPGVVEFPLNSAGVYSIFARAALNCQNTVYANATDNPSARFWLRVLPRASQDQPLEGAMVEVFAHQSVPPRDLNLESGVEVSIDPRSATSDPANRQAIYSYVRITAGGSTVRIEGHTFSGGLRARLDPALNYDVLVIPDAPAMPDLAVAPLLFQGTPVQLAKNLFTMDQGVAIGGQVTSSKGPVPGARVLLRNGVVPSTTGVVRTGGDFDLRARISNDLAAAIIPPEKSGLPEAHLPSGSGLALYDPLPPRVGLDFTWAAVSTTTLDLTVASSTGAAVAGEVRVRLASLPDAFPDVGTLTLTLTGTPGQMDQHFDYHPQGAVLLDRTSDARGAVTFTDVPRGRYTATLSPLDGSAAITTVPVDLRGAAARIPLTARLAAKIALSGKLLPAATTAGATVLALDSDADPAVPTPSAVVDAGGGYLMHIDPGRSYILMMEAIPGRSLPRTFLGTVPAQVKDSVRETLTIPTGLAISGRVIDASRNPVSGARVEAYCIGRSPSCIDLQAPSTSGVRPAAESISDGNGAYRLLVPDPAK